MLASFSFEIGVSPITISFDVGDPTDGFDTMVGLGSPGEMLLLVGFETMVGFESPG